MHIVELIDASVHRKLLHPLVPVLAPASSSIVIITLGLSKYRLSIETNTFFANLPEVTMCSMPADEQFQASRLLQLPREIRDLIYEYALVRDTVPIDCAVVEGPGYRRHTGFPCPYSPQLHKAYPLTSPRVHRSTWFLPIYDLKVDIEGGTWMEPKQAQMTYQLGQPCARPNGKQHHDKIALQLLLVCQTICREARQVFYKKNVFSFTGKFPISTALTFLQDRSVTAQALLSSIEILLTEDNNMRGTAEAHFPPTKRSSDCLVLQHAFHYFTALCNLLSSNPVHLRQLYLTIESSSSYGDSQPKSLPECLTWELEKSDAGRPWIASWINPCFKSKVWSQPRSIGSLIDLA